MHKAAVLALGVLATTCRAFEAVILADTNRDGKVDITGDSDVAQKYTWTEERGAIFMANIADTNHRCSARNNSSRLDKCHDASDNILRNPKYLAPLRTVANRTLSDAAKGKIFVSGKDAEKNVRIFHKNGDDWSYVNKSYVFRPADLRAGLELGIDARDVSRPKGWDGMAMVNFKLTDLEESANDTVALRVAPILIPHDKRRLEKMSVSTHKSHPGWELFAQHLETYLVDHRFEEPLTRIDSERGWAHDHFKAGYTSMPGPDGPVSLRVYVKGCLRGPEGQRVFADMRGDWAGAVRHYEASDLDSDQLGNIEIIPPHSHNGASYPAGRAVMGFGHFVSNHKAPRILKFLQAQKLQYPFTLDHSWLFHGQIADYMQFVPVNSSRGWTMIVADPVGTLNLFKKAQADGHGETIAISHHTFLRTENELDCDSLTIDQLLRLPLIIKTTEWSGKNIAHSINVIKNETGITEDEIIRVPTLFYAYDGIATLRQLYCYGDRYDKPPRTMPLKALRWWPHYLSNLAKNLFEVLRSKPWPSKAIYPTATNGIYFENGQYLSPYPFGPLIGESDIFIEAIREAFGKAGLNVTFFENWSIHHMRDGGIERAVNVERDIFQRWWTMAGADETPLREVPPGNYTQYRRA
ncbi:hypothetical protein J3458_009528 [Metarhizium acridum]|uniref:Arginine deiminase type-3 n=1 Tax=Metarhizium acridum (strain CQMa 102) TaxID=655827 RepID=E9EC73_METAQ|nr:arginine deiminase type-3 [Metarhizium acridum CQMa 102]EFY86457.1 arginine deiminase type-3 [Metarhizium acridum CQMa 102]KAG8415705.1 hypothetical protein J3458_009528 [Metarhizium acridum]